MIQDEQIEYGGSAAAIRHHYDVGNDFYSAWLDPTMTYSSAMWDGLPKDAPLEEAQQRKLAYHAESVGAAGGMRILDVGCGWGGMMRNLRRSYGVAECVGLTLSEEQLAYIEGLGDPGISAVLSNWHDYRPDKPFDAIISVGAFEHFAHPQQSVDERRGVYREFFQACRDWTAGKGRLSLQTIAYGKMSPEDANPFISNEIFPAAELPTLEDIVVASKGLFRIERLRDDGLDYARTCEMWSNKLRGAVRSGVVDPDIHPVEKYSRYLRMSAAGFRMRKIGLLRIAFAAE
ncbi:cyclopropane-fatty-acyl-phospholipid synthase family protein (plasmid) [Sphingobium sp. SJ10-10]|uniref:cyclopropane-fatty-acyl-phospholipid synthase family protein n=1 Tax=Sphingobium sp. SJ10-10 TaxID=3114999 RepID=UPI002E19705C|nr:cyclopropane-fatty-acyl-phospholipid synthase family protein [Sphingobium sp. SJ10-10]